MRFTQLGVGCLLLVAAQASAGALQPKKASEVVALTTSGAVCPGFPSGGLLLDHQITADGAEVAFALPAKHVLVLTELKAAANGVASIANHGIMAIAMAGTTVPYGGLWVLTGRADADGSVSIHEAIPSGIAVRAPNLCMAVLDVTAGNTPASNVGRFAYGFLAADK